MPCGPASIPERAWRPAHEETSGLLVEEDKFSTLCIAKREPEAWTAQSDPGKLLQKRNGCKPIYGL